MANSDLWADFKLYYYNPSLAAAIVFVILFFIPTAFHAFMLVKTRTWCFIPFLIGGCFEVIGYIGRAISATESPNWTLGPYIIQNLLILLAPALFAASIYMMLARIIVLTDGESHSVIKVRWVTKVFVAGDVLSFLAQSAGGGLLAKADTQDAVKLGENIIVGGLGIQLFVFGFFILVSAIFNVRIRAVPTQQSRSVPVPWQQHLFVLYLASALILIRSTFRVIEYVMGNTGVLLTHEYYLYIFDAVLMFGVMVLFTIWHPSKVIRRRTFVEGEADEHGSSYPLEESSDPASRKMFNAERY